MATIRVHIIPNAKMDELVGAHGDAIKIRLRARAVEGKANAALVRFLAARLRILPRQIALIRGHKSREKVICIEVLSESAVQEGLRVDR